MLAMRAISKQFPGVCALDNVDLDLYGREVHAVVGENGAGKSTLMKILSGAYHPDGGEIMLNGQRVDIQDALHAQKLGISIVYQELNLFPNLSVVENILAARQPVSKPLGLIDRKRATARAMIYLDMFGFEVSPNRLVRTLSIAQQQIVEIAKALSLDARVLILDEPTSALTEAETERLFEIIGRCRDEDLTITYVSHRLEEVFTIADRITVLRDGRLVQTVDKNAVTPEQVISMMVGRELHDLYGQRTAQSGTEILRVEHLSLQRQFHDVSFTLHRGEILGMAGLIGAGRSEVARAIIGAQRPEAGQVFIDGRPAAIRSPQDSIHHGVAYLSENRRADGLFLNMSVCGNIIVSQLKELATGGMLSRQRERRAALDYVRQLQIRTPNVEQPVVKLSGGNQQKVILSRWLAVRPKVLIADEPTRGIDVGAKAEIYALLRQLAAQGMGILLISSELPEVLGMSDRILVMREGELAGELSGASATEEQVMTLCAGHTSAKEKVA
jgi:ribose transport system ATP-binding protein